MEGTLRGSIADVLEGQISGSLELLAGEPVLENLSVSSNGVYEPRTGVDGFDKVTVSVPEPELETLNVTQNGTYTPGSGVDGFDEVNVNVPSDEPVLDSIEINENGHYTPPAGTDGYDDITVYVPYVSQGTTINNNGTYTPPSGVDGFSQVRVDVPNTVQGLNVTENGTYTAPVGSGVVGYSPVTVNVTPPPPVTSVLNVTHNGTFYPQLPSVGFSEVVVNCPVPDEIILFDGTIMEPSNITWGTYGMTLSDGKLISSGQNTGFYISAQDLGEFYIVKIYGNNPNDSTLFCRTGRCSAGSSLPTIEQSGTGRLSNNSVKPAKGDFVIAQGVGAITECIFFASSSTGTGSNLPYNISKIVAIKIGTIAGVYN